MKHVVSVSLDESTIERIREILRKSSFVIYPFFLIKLCPCGHIRHWLLQLFVTSIEIVLGYAILSMNSNSMYLIRYY